MIKIHLYIIYNPCYSKSINYVKVKIMTVKDFDKEPNFKEIEFNSIEWTTLTAKLEFIQYILGQPNNDLYDEMKSISDHLLYDYKIDIENTEKLSMGKILSVLQYHLENDHTGDLEF